MNVKITKGCGFSHFNRVIARRKVCIFTLRKTNRMKCTIHVYLLNEHFSQEHADAHYNGEESENNLKYEWEDEIAITSNVEEIVEHENAAFPLQGQLPNGEEFSHDVLNMFLFEIKSSDAPVSYVGASASIVETHELIKDENGFTLKLFLKDFEPMSNPVPGIYVASKEFPQALVF